MYQSGRVGDEAKKRKSPTKSRRVGITAYMECTLAINYIPCAMCNRLSESNAELSTYHFEFHPKKGSKSG